MAKPPLVSIIIPAYNVGPYLDECLSSIAKQSYTNIEAIVVDDGSTDNSLEIAQAFAKRDKRFSSVNEGHVNAGHARNRGLSLAKGDYLLFFDADDRMKLNAIEVMANKAVETQADMVICNAQSFDTNTNAIVEEHPDIWNVEYNRVYSSVELAPRIFQNFVGWPWNKLVRSQFIKEKGLVFQSLSSTNDAYFVYLAIVQAQRIVCVDQILVQHRKRGGSIEKSRGKSPHNAHLAIEAIGQKLQILPDGKLFEQSYKNWAIFHSRWNFMTLEGEPRREALNDYLNELHDTANEPDSFFADYADVQVRNALRSDDDLQTKCIKSVIDAHYACCERNDIRDEAEQQAQRFREDFNRQADHVMHLTNEVARLNEEVARLREETSEAKQKQAAAEAWAAELENSTTFKVGSTITAVPRKIKDARAK